MSLRWKIFFYTHDGKTVRSHFATAAVDLTNLLGNRSRGSATDAGAPLVTYGPTASGDAAACLLAVNLDAAGRIERSVAADGAVAALDGRRIATLHGQP